VRFDAVVDGHKLRAEVRRTDGGYVVTLDGTTIGVDLLETGDHFLSLLVEGRSYEVGVEKRDGKYRVHLPDGSVTVDLSEASREGAARPRGPSDSWPPCPGGWCGCWREEGTRSVQDRVSS
jgi:hypothetical protein